jgi:hypothetical protein
MELFIILVLGVWFLWAFIFGGFKRALDGNMFEWTLLLITFLAIFIVPTIIYFL